MLLERASYIKLKTITSQISWEKERNQKNMKSNWKLFKNILTRCSESHNPPTEKGGHAS